MASAARFVVFGVALCISHLREERLADSVSVAALHAVARRFHTQDLVAAVVCCSEASFVAIEEVAR